MGVWGVLIGFINGNWGRKKKQKEKKEEKKLKTTITRPKSTQIRSNFHPNASKTAIFPNKTIKNHPWRVF
jgi:Na+/glutamate symporter